MKRGGASKLLLLLVLAGAAVLSLFLLEHEKGEEEECPDGKCPIKRPRPAPTPPTPEPDTPRPRKPWGPRFLPPVGGVGSSLSLDVLGAQRGGRTFTDGTELQCDLPGDMHLKNCGGSDGAGLCVFTSISHSARWQNVPLLEDFQAYMKKYPGGGHPEKVDRMIDQIAREKNIPRPDYIQVEGDDLEILKAACKSGRMPGVTYNFSPTGRYNGQHIAHMVNLVHADDKHFVVLDNNYPGDVNYEWMTPEEFKKVWCGNSQNGWAVILLEPGPPLPPHNP